MFPSKTALERKADGWVHTAGLAFLIPASALLVHKAMQQSDPLLLTAVIGYALAALFSLGVSFAYHLLPRHDLRAVLRRWDHAAIYIVIAGVFGPLLVVCGTPTAFGILGLLWFFTIVGLGFKLSGANPDSPWSLVSYLGMGWFGLFALPDFWAGLPGVCVALLGAGGVFYTIGTLFYRRKEMAYRYPIWHTFGTCGGLCFFATIWVAVGA
ncbi:hemolysin III family protein [uncultured Erythrobacter sp.]|uniref:PAQR family membrane homeostasis protein TrhA n=1 Tax=uncultured Erythrobacter sp. TaxID=263913 RepID=UPI002618D279|nr:hemolysin III family protein [uncultured Erythrobacter sp.]